MKPIHIVGPLAIIALLWIAIMPVDKIELMHMKVRLCDHDETCIAKVIEAF